MVGMITGFWVSQLVRAVAGLNLAEHLADGSFSAAELAEREGIDQRLDTLAGDFFKGVPEPDLYLLKFILHDWDDESCVKILRNCRTAMGPRGRVAVVEMVIDAVAESGLAELQDLNMLVATSGRNTVLSSMAPC